MNRLREDQPIFAMMEELAADGVMSVLRMTPIGILQVLEASDRWSWDGPAWFAAIGEGERGYFGRTPQEAWRAACNAWEKRRQPKPSRIYPSEAGTTKHYLTDKGLPYSVTFLGNQSKP